MDQRDIARPVEIDRVIGELGRGNAESVSIMSDSLCWQELVEVEDALLEAPGLSVESKDFIRFLEPWSHFKGTSEAELARFVSLFLQSSRHTRSKYKVKRF